ncbi:AAA family ATPase [Chryseobacterium scophthalmum]|uniref:AAA family ATPase n=1 Tax=Chryseobacterium scophthalmum TaxID=59733 RepID=UPI00398AEC89
MSFKLIAVRPLDDCNPDFLKNLEENRIYKFYNDYTFLNLNNDTITTFGKYNYIKVKSVKNNTTIPQNLYGKNINISAVVGKNGSGKSAIIELLIATFNNLAKIYGFIVNHNGYEDVDFLKHVEKINIEFYFEINNTIYKVKLEEKEKVNIEILKFDGNEFIPFLKNFKEFIQEHFFYTNIINYSIWAYNHHEIGDFITALFHKNDAYQIPIVLNPYRQQGGIFSPETEKELALDRLLYNVFQLSDNSRKITENLELEKIELELRNDNFNDYQMFRYKKGDQIQQLKYSDFLRGMSHLGSKEIYQIDDIFKALYAHYGLNYADFKNENWKSVNDYLLYKVIKIVTRYSEFQIYLDLDNQCFWTETFDKFLTDIITDTSHITLKIRQTLNFIKFYNELNINLETKEIDPVKYAIKINELSNENLPILDLLPPPIFKIELILTNNLKYKSLSSGEKQMIITVQSVLYHLINLNSIKSKDHKIKYKNINLIFEEIELYFHPEYQRIFLKRIVDGISNLNFNETNINLIFVTHSPFILSDLPKQNVLFLDIDEESKKSQSQDFNRMNTFGANITDLLADSFFIKDGLIGNLAKKKIEEVIKYLNGNENLITDNIEAKKIIDIIDEPILKYKLEDMYFEKFPEEFDTKKEIEDLLKRAQKLGLKIQE